jgi:hypothetical protein
MPPVLKGDIWPLFVSEGSLVYHQAVVYVCCKSYTRPIPLGVGKSLQQKLKGSPQDINDGRSQAKEPGLVVGRDKSMISHVRACGSITTADKVKAEAYYTSKGRAPASIIQTKSAGASFKECPPANLQEPPSERRKTATRIEEYAAFGNHFRDDTNEHACLIAELVSVNKVPFNVLSSPQFRRLQDFYLASAERTAKSGLVVHPAKIRAEMLPLRYEEVVARSSARINLSPLRDQFTLADDGWSSLRKIHYRTITIGAPGVPAETVAFFRLSPLHLHSVAVAKGWEKVIILGDRSAALEDYRPGFAVPLPRSPSAYVSDSAGPNVRARAIASLRHPKLIFLACLAHVFALLCGDYITSSSHHAVIARSQRVVHSFNSSSSVWLPLLL